MGRARGVHRVLYGGLLAAALLGVCEGVLRVRYPVTRTGMRRLLAVLAPLPALVACPVVTDVPIEDGTYTYLYTDDDGPDLQEGLTMTLAGDRATFDFLDADGDSAMTVLGLERRSPEDWLRYTPPKNIDGYRCERAGFDVAGFDLPGVLDGPGGAPAIAHVVAAESSDTPLIVAECSMDGDIVFLHTVTARSDGAEVGHAVFQRVPDGAPSPG